MSNRMPGEIRDPDTGKIDYKEIWYKLRSAFAVLLSLAVLAGAGWFVYDKARGAWMEFRTAEDYIGEGVAPVEVTIPEGATLGQISDILVQAKVVKTAKAFDREAEANADSKTIQPGKRMMKTELPAKVALSMLLDKNLIIRNRFTLAEGKWLAQQYPVMEKATGVTVKEFKAAAKDWKKLGLPTWAEHGLEGFLFPDTYEVPEKPTAKSVIKMATKQFAAVAKELDLEATAEEMGRTPYQVLVMASIVEKETFKAEDRPKVARVILNRLKAGTPLGMDSVIAYAVKKSGVLELTAEDLAIDSPYNTRTRKGLPPTPINSPTKSAIEAALHPAEGDWTYFITVDPSSGETLFTANYDEFLAGKQKYKDWCEASKENRKVCYGE
ncbi:MAG TPA: endolytic transglycosylase MltG [Propionicimonas sp.]|nr:endolytic transglycosylase MltG [Propionicimonas sp.]HQA77070.1 endolytic transglycosylase MltG [Propionicimonas sp.]HQD96200.1 endolytic transglycosylase MltG [Propionicimonas sp.]